MLYSPLEVIQSPSLDVLSHIYGPSSSLQYLLAGRAWHSLHPRCASGFILFAQMVLSHEVMCEALLWCSACVLQVDLEALGGVSTGLTAEGGLDLLHGLWRLRYSNTSDVLSILRLPNLGPLPFPILQVGVV